MIRCTYSRKYNGKPIDNADFLTETVYQARRLVDKWNSQQPTRYEYEVVKTRPYSDDLPEEGWLTEFGITYVHVKGVTANMNNDFVASELTAIAKDLQAFEFPTEDAMKKYLDNHPKADKSKHKVKEVEKDAPAQKDAPGKDKGEKKEEAPGKSKPEEYAKTVREYDETLDTNKTVKPHFIEMDDGSLTIQIFNKDGVMLTPMLHRGGNPLIDKGDKDKAMEIIKRHLGDRDWSKVPTGEDFQKTSDGLHKMYDELESIDLTKTEPGQKIHKPKSAPAKPEVKPEAPKVESKPEKTEAEEREELGNQYDYVTSVRKQFSEATGGKKVQDILKKNDEMSDWAAKRSNNYDVTEPIMDGIWKGYPKEGGEDMAKGAEFMVSEGGYSREDVADQLHLGRARTNAVLELAKSGTDLVGNKLNPEAQKALISKKEGQLKEWDTAINLFKKGDKGAAPAAPVTPEVPAKKAPGGITVMDDKTQKIEDINHKIDEMSKDQDQEFGNTLNRELFERGIRTRDEVSDEGFEPDEEDMQQLSDQLSKESESKPEDETDDEEPVKPEEPKAPAKKSPAKEQHSAQFDNFEINLSQKQAEAISQGGQDAMPAVKKLMKDPDIKKQLDSLNPDDVRKELADYGAWDDDELADDEANKQRILWISGGNIRENISESGKGDSDHPDMPLKNHQKAKVNSGSLVKVQNVMKAHQLTGGEDELQELAGFKKTLGQRVPEKDVGKYYVRNAQKLKKDFLANMDPANYKDAQAFATAKARLQKMPVEDFAKILAAINEDEDTITGADMNRMVVASELLRIAKDLLAIEFPTQDAMDKYLKEHPDADRSNHKVVPTKKEAPAAAPEHKDMPLKKHSKAKVNSGSLVKVQSVMSAHKLTGGEDELQELAGFKKTLGQRIPQKDVGKYYVRNEQKLKKDFLANMDPSNYANAEAFATAKKRMQEMPVSDFGKLLAAINEDEEV